MVTYRGADVDIVAGVELVERIKPMAASTRRPGAAADLGGFGGLFDLAAAGYRDPVLVAATDGVGTKLLLARDAARHDTVGIDLVAMCVNDLLAQGAEPLFFLDYLATAKLDPAAAAEVIEGIAAGCREARCALIGGETAELPGLYAPGDYDLAGFAVGAGERGKLIDGSLIKAGDLVLGLASSGLHSTGFSLIRKVVEEGRYDLAGAAPFGGALPLGEALLAPTRIYVASLLPQIRAGRIKGLAHITGGGLVENIPRILPSGLSARLDATSWPLPGMFSWLAAAGPVAAAEMVRTFNCGIGMVAVAAPEDADALAGDLRATGEVVFEIGVITDRPEPSLVFDDLAAAWPA